MLFAVHEEQNKMNGMKSSVVRISFHVQGVLMSPFVIIFNNGFHLTKAEKWKFNEANAYHFRYHRPINQRLTGLSPQEL